ncbi:ABC-type glycerol-3-phosphate transport system substrate-binding protein [Thermocatellispora tengchongensis]|uniref:ABC-type glycerol-3-phosphate transport system substrate-binding protein n=1 Tax=Thermocatellispora tengchongensis TaxID=1073253 RepID=A0A840NWP3_9ACTN|nr:extracellular solute-binding protein [Thermocatellispora tengchongensis]MBB5133254.1 ABC-type glycerol-3-phosphate transport system substrate-binding protein [Thermocatellispora tengchongensis]
MTTFRHAHTRTTLFGGTAALALALTACGAPSSGGSASGDGTVTITVGDRPSADQAAARAFFDRRVQEFHQAHPGIRIEPSETVWDVQTFQANVAGGTLPDVIKVPFTEIQSLIARRQVADITDELKAVGLADQLNPQTLKIVQGRDGRIYGVPVLPYAIGLFYNRALFEKAGLDPAKPPRTWDEVRTAAKAIAEKTGQAGYAQMTTENTGGWMLTAQSYSMGGSIESEDGSKATFDDAATRNALTYLKQMRWEDDSMGTNFLYNMNDIAKDFAAGKIGMFLSVPSAAYQAAVTNFGMAKEDVGLTAVPTGPGNDNRVLSGGSVEIVNPKASPAEKAAALKWIRFFDLHKYIDQEAAVADAKATAQDGGAVGIPRLSPVAPETFERYESWIAGHVNVPLENFTGYTGDLATVQLKTEPVRSAQEVYAVLDTVLQKVLTDKDADIAALLAEAVATVDAKLARAPR